MKNLILPALLVAIFASCQSAYYATMEKLGVDKREIMVDRVESARDGQIEAKEQIQTTFEVFKELTQFSGGDLEEVYDRLKGEYEDAEDRAGSVSGRIAKVEDVADALFDEWETEIGTITSEKMRAQSSRLRSEAMDRYEGMVRSMHASESKMIPVLAAFSDHVILLKHNLNAEAISGLEGTAIEIEGNVADLIQSMQESIDEADSFLGRMK